MKPMTMIFATIIIAAIAPPIGASGEDGKAPSTAYKYAELAIIDTVSDNDRNASTVIWLDDGSGKEIAALKTDTLSKGLDVRRSALNAFLLKLKKVPSDIENPTDITILNILGQDGFELVHFERRVERDRTGENIRNKYLFKKRLR